tara:strand:+ start:10209 stop:10973 length:765 start_codon:yes stop_codon:yes gene_type:complete
MEARSILGIFLLILLTCAVILIIKMTISKFSGNSKNQITVVDKPVKMEADMQTCTGILPASGGAHTYSFWMYVSQWEMTQDKPKYIFRREHIGNNLNVALGDSNNELQIWLSNSNGARIPRSSCELGLDNDDTHRLINLPLQAWNHITLTIWEKTLDLYLNGKLTRTFILAQPVQSNNAGSFYMGSLSANNERTVNGFVSRFKYFTRVLSPRDIYNLYLKGPAKSSDLSDTPESTIINLSVNVGQESPSCATAK